MLADSSNSRVLDAIDQDSTPPAIHARPGLASTRRHPRKPRRHCRARLRPILGKRPNGDPQLVFNRPTERTLPAKSCKCSAMDRAPRPSRWPGAHAHGRGAVEARARALPGSRGDQLGVGRDAGDGAAAMIRTQRSGACLSCECSCAGHLSPRRAGLDLPSRVSRHRALAGGDPPYGTVASRAGLDPPLRVHDRCQCTASVASFRRRIKAVRCIRSGARRRPVPAGTTPARAWCGSGRRW